MSIFYGELEEYSCAALTSSGNLDDVLDVDTLLDLLKFCILDSGNPGIIILTDNNCCRSVSLHMGQSHVIKFNSVLFCVSGDVSLEY